ncbi:hypothetical protein FRC08_012452 [Ceratobasidium sp. 394]|nr:hypothetical protein FRC08_012452 [Ceratobasidium sp. 394]
MTVPPWHVYIIRRESWIFWMQASALRDHPASQTSTDLRSGNVSSPPPASPSNSPQVPKPLRAKKGKSCTQPLATLSPDVTANAPPVPPAAPVSGAVIRRNPSASSLRVPRDPPAGRVARKAHSTVSASNTRASRLARSVVSGSIVSGSTPTSTSAGHTPTQSEAFSVAPALPPVPPNPPNQAHVFNPSTMPTARAARAAPVAPAAPAAPGVPGVSAAPVALNTYGAPNLTAMLSMLTLLGVPMPTDMPSPSNLPAGPGSGTQMFTSNQYTELLRHLHKWEGYELDIASQRAKNEARIDTAELEMLQQAQAMAQIELQQRLQLDRMRAAREEVSSTVDMYNSTVSTEHSMALNTAATLPPSHLLYQQANSWLERLINQPVQVNLPLLTDRAESRLAQILGEIPGPRLVEQSRLASLQPALLAPPTAGPSRASSMGNAAYLQPADSSSEQGETSGVGVTHQATNTAEMVEEAPDADDDEGSLYDEA